jgi:hypothetical protein
MIQQLTMIFDGEVFRPETPLDLLPNMRYRVTIETESQDDSLNVWDFLDSVAGSIDAPSDWSSQHDHYLYGTPKRSDQEV